MTILYIMAVVMWIVIIIIHFSLRSQTRLTQKSKENNVLYLTGKVYLKLHSDGVISSLYVKDKKIADDVLEYSNGIFKIKFKTIFSSLSINKFTNKITGLGDERNNTLK